MTKQSQLKRFLLSSLSCLTLLFSATLSAQEEADYQAAYVKLQEGYRALQQVKNLRCSVDESKVPFPLGLYFYSDYIWWKMNQSGTDFAIDGVQTDQEGKLYALPGEFAPGYRLGLGFGIPDRLWRFTVDWTHYRSSQSKNISPQAALDLYPTRTLPNGAAEINFASGVWKSQLDTFTLQLAYAHLTRDQFTFLPHLGIRGDWISRRLQVFYDGIGGNLNPDSLFHTLSRYWGVGPEMGISGYWNTICGLSIFADGGVIMQWGVLEFHQVNDVLQNNDNEDVNFRDHFQRNQFWLKAELGVRWCCSLPIGGHLALQASWEGLTTVTTGEVLRFTDESRDGAVVPTPISLETAGLNLRGEFCF